MENTMIKKMHYYKNFEGKQVEYKLRTKKLTISELLSFTTEVAGAVVSREIGYSKLLTNIILDYCLIKYFTDITLFKDDEFSLDKVESFIDNNYVNVIDVIRNEKADEVCALIDACDDAIEYRRMHYDRVGEFLDAITNMVNTLANRERIDMDAVNKLVDVVSVMKNMDNKDVARAIIGMSNEKTAENTDKNKTAKNPTGKKTVKFPADKMTDK